MRGDFVYSHHEAYRFNLYLQKEDHSLFPRNTSTFLRLTRENTDNASDHTSNDYWNEESDVALSEKWIGPTRFQILRTKLPEGHDWVGGRPTKNAHHHTTRLNLARTVAQIDELANWDEEQSRLQESRRQSGLFEVSLEVKDW